MRLARITAILRRRVRRVAGAVTRLRARDIPTLLRIAWLVARYQRLHGSRPLPELARSFDAQSRMGAAESSEVGRITYLIDLVMKTVYRDRYCMKRSLLHLYFLGKRRLPVTLHFGIRRTGEVMAGHAWVEVGGRPYAERYDPRTRFVETYRYPLPEARHAASTLDTWHANSAHSSGADTSPAARPGTNETP